MSPARAAAALRGRLPGLRRLARAVDSAQVEEAAACARALTALVGKVPEVDLLPGGASRVPRAVLTARVLQDAAPCPWPAGLSRQTDPDDPAFLPPLAMHPLLVARDRTLLGLPDRERLAWVDPLGWCGVGDGPAVAVWFGDGAALWPVGRRPGERGDEGPDAVWQERGLGGVSVATWCRRGPLTLELTHFPVVLDGRTAYALHARLHLSEGPPRPVRLAFAIRPAGHEGVAPIFHLARTADGLWLADGEPVLALAEPGEELWTGVHGEPDPWAALSGQVPGALPQAPAAVERRDPVGLATGVELCRGTVAPGEPWARFAVLMPPPGVGPALVRTSGRSLWVGAQADRRGLLGTGCELVLRQHQPVLEAARLRLLIEPARIDLGGLLGAVALARLGFLRRAGDRIGEGLRRVRRDGTLAEAEGPETPAVLAWAASEHLRWTDARQVAQATRQGWLRLVERLVDEVPPPGGHALFGSAGSPHWSALWRAAALVGAASVLRELGEDVTRFGMAGARACEELGAALGDGPWRAAPDRAPDGTAAALLAAPWLGVVGPDHRGVGPTLDFLRQRAWHGGGVLMHGGAHVAGTALWVAAQERRDPTQDLLGIVAALASPTGALPTSRHPARGALGEGDDLLSAALFVLLAVERVQAARGVLRVLPGLLRARGLPTPYGPVDLDEDGLRGQWRGPAPRVEGT